MGKDRRRYPRVGLELGVSLEAFGTRWQGKTLDLSPYGARVALPPGPLLLAVGRQVELRLALPGGDPPLSLTASVVRVDPDGVALNFVDPGALPFARLKDLVGVSVQPLRDRRKARRADAALDIGLDADVPRCWEGKYKSIDLSTSGVKVTWPRTAPQPSWGTGVQLRLAGPDGHPPIRVKGIVWRREAQSVVFLFIELRPEQRERLQALVDSLGSAAVAAAG